VAAEPGAGPDSGEEFARGPGERLRRARAQRGLSVEDAQRETRIPRRLLEALEEDRYEAFPATVYLHGSLRTYCEFLELDAAEMLAEISGAARSQSAAEAAADGRDAHVPSSKPRQAREPREALEPREDSNAGETPRLLGVLAFALAASGIAYWIFGGAAADAPPRPAERRLPPGFETSAQEVSLELRF